MTADVTSIRLTEKEREEIDRVVVNGQFMSRSDFIRTAIWMMLRDLKGVPEHAIKTGQPIAEVATV